MELLRALWAEARHRILLWALGSLLFFAITAMLGLRGTFSAVSAKGKPGSEQQVRKDVRSPDTGW
jgi:hypothetical protein